VVSGFAWVPARATPVSICWCSVSWLLRRGLVPIFQAAWSRGGRVRLLKPQPNRSGDVASPAPKCS
jgi:hypothetical protein